MHTKQPETVLNRVSRIATLAKRAAAPVTLAALAAAADNALPVTRSIQGCRRYPTGKSHRGFPPPA